ncbi:MAG: hypothetical protein ACOCRK_08320 [bacterium]
MKDKSIDRDTFLLLKSQILLDKKYELTLLDNLNKLTKYDFI